MSVKIFAVESRTPFDLEKLSNKFRHRNTGWTIPEAFLCVLFSAAMADDDLAPEERETIATIVKRSRALQSMSPHDLTRAQDVVGERMEADKDTALQDACHTLPAEMCLPVFAHCVDIVLADGELLPNEAEYLEKITELLDIDDDHRRRVMEVLLLKAQY